MPTYDNRRSWSRDFPGAPTTMRVPPELGGLGCDCGGQMNSNYMTNCPPANLAPPTISTLLLPTSTLVSSPALAPASSDGGMGLGALALLGLGALLLFGGKQRNPQRNIAMGFWAGRGAKRKFHPIRASHDYDPSRTGERSRRKRSSRKRRR